MQLKKVNMNFYMFFFFPIQQVGAGRSPRANLVLTLSNSDLMLTVLTLHCADTEHWTSNLDIKTTLIWNSTVSGVLSFHIILIRKNYISQMALNFNSVIKF